MTPEQLAVADTNEAFYRAISQRDLPAIAELWFPAEWAECTHPGAMAVRGWDAIYDSWQKIFEFQPLGVAISTSEVRVRLIGDVAWVSCLERVAMTDADQIHTTLSHATNLYVRHDGRWRMVGHHASPVPFVPPQASASGSSLVN